MERPNGYLETSFLPGRSFASPADFNAQLADWLVLVNERRRRVLGCAPTDRIEVDRAGMLPLPPVAPVTGWRSSLRLPLTITCGWTAMTTRSTQRWSAAASRTLPTWTASACGVTVGWSPTTFAAGRVIRPSAIPGTCRPRPGCAPSGPPSPVVTTLRSSGEGRIRAARFPARKSLEEFDFNHARSLKRETIAHLGTLDFVAGRENVVFLGPPGIGKTHLAIGLGIRACQAGHRVLFATAAGWVNVLADAHAAGRLQGELVRLGATRSSWSTRSATSP